MRTWRMAVMVTLAPVDAVQEEMSLFNILFPVL